MNKMIHLGFRAALLTTLLASGCDDTDDDTSQQGTGTETSGAEGESGGPQECEQAGVEPAVAELVNAPVAADVEIVEKVPQHPGLPGPLDLP